MAGTLVGVGTASAASVAVDYAQCANGKPPGTSLECPDGWINGILQASNSHYSEDQVTPQRLTANVDGAGEHSITLKYQVSKGTTHAYDSLATWNYTQTGLGFGDRCDELTASKCAGGVSKVVPDTSIGIPDDPNSVGVVHPGGNGSAVTATHMIPAGAGRTFHMFGDNGVNPAFTDFEPYVHSVSGNDEYATLTVNFTTVAAGKVQLLFGGHLAAPTGPRGWGTGFGASDINGGPYHIKWDAFDGESVGQRDNQIMGSAILSFQVGITTVANPTSAVIGTATNLSDTATITGGNNPTGTVTFSLFGPYGAGVTPDCLGTAVVATATGTVSNSSATGTASNVTLNQVGDYYWVASYLGDGINQPQTSLCGDPAEKVTVGKATPTGTTVMNLSDTVTVTGVSPTGNVTFTLYKDDGANTCTAGTKVGSDSTKALSNGTATSDLFTGLAAGTYRWLVTYEGDGNNNSGVVSNCTEVATITY